MAPKKNVGMRLTPAKTTNSGGGILDNMTHEGLWEQVAKLNPEKIAKRAGCRFLSDPDRCIVTMLNSRYEVNLGGLSISVLRDDSTPEDAGYIEQLCILAYLLGAKDIPFAGKLVKAESLPGGQFFFRGLHTLPTDRLARAFGDNPEGLIRASEQFDAEQCEFGDASIRLNVLPRIPLTLVIWRKDEEYDARASILFDQTAAAQIPLDALWATVNLTVKKLLEVGGAGC
ncbi:MAG: DUF3786 domain-containing protein [Sedimentisphaerales bacterium]|nr:DUF3786 domain-containing protein [Sedimentisphaerales bacterium]